MGKTSLLHQYVHKTFYEDYRTTLGASILTKVLAVDNSPLKLQVSVAGTAQGAHPDPRAVCVPPCPAVPKCPPGSRGAGLDVPSPIFRARLSEPDFQHP